MGFIHGAGVERGYLVVVHVSRYIRLCRVLMPQFGNVAATDAMLVHPPGVGFEVLTGGTHGQRVTAQHFQAKRNISGTTPEFAAHVRYQETHIQYMDLVRKNMVLESIFKHHDGVVG